MKKSFYILPAILIFSIFLISCGGEDASVTEMTDDEIDYIPALTEEDQVKQGEADKEYYQRAKAEGNPALCDKINFSDLKKLCLEKASEGSAT